MESRTWALFRVLGMLLAGAAVAAAAPTERAASGAVVLLTLEGAVSPATADYAVRGIRGAGQAGAELVVIQIDTPGGLDTSMRSIVREILASPVPVAAYVAPSGSRAASAGTFIVYASHIAAMAPATNLGAATPVQIGGGQDGEPKKAPDKDRKKRAAKDDQPERPRDALTSKQIEDAVAYIRSLAQLRGRNAEWGEQAVRDAVSLPAGEALERGVIEIVAEDLPDLLRRVDGRTVTAQGRERTLKTEGAPVTAVEPDWRTRVLAVIANPSVAVILMMIGIYGLLFEFSNPGFVVPGVAGAISLLLAFYAFQLLPVNYVGVALILLGMALIVAEVFAPSFGALGIGGAAALGFGLFVLIDPEEAGGYAPSIPFIVTLTALSAATAFAAAYLALRARRRPVVSGREDLLDARGEALADFDGSGWILVRGENWRAVTGRPVARGQRVRVTGIEGLTLRVEPE